MPGCAAWTAARASNSRGHTSPVTVATRREPTTSPRIAWAAPVTPSTAATAFLAYGTRDDPAAVRATLRADRSIKVTPSSRSSFWIWVLMPDWLMRTSSAAAVNEPSSTTARK